MRTIDTFRLEIHLVSLMEFLNRNQTTILLLMPCVGNIPHIL